MRFALFCLVLSFGCGENGTDDDQVHITPTPFGAAATAEQIGDSNQDEAHVSIQEPIDESIHCPSPLVNSRLMKRVIKALLIDKNRTKFLYWDDQYGSGIREGDREEDLAYVVYVFKGVRYTLWHNPPSEFVSEYSDEPIQMEGHIAVWERPNGTHTQYHLDTYSDENFTGCANFGVGDEERLGPHGLLFHWNMRRVLNDGVDNHAFWQKRYAKAIKGLAYTLGVL